VVLSIWCGAVLAVTSSGCAEALPVADDGHGAQAEDPAVAEQRIIGGQPTNLFPAVGALTLEGYAFCTGTLITPTVVLSAAHCVVGLRPHEVRFALGSDAAAPHTSLPVARLEPHPDYYDLRHDIARVHLGTPAPAEIAPVGVLSEMDDSFEGTPLVFVGYGVTDGQRQTGAGLKRSVAVPVSDLARWTFSYQQRGGGTCHGDSGGPALHQDDEGRWLVAGVTSYGDATCRRFGVDTRVDAYLSFVLGPDGGQAAGGAPTDSAAPHEPTHPGASGDGASAGSPAREQEPNDSKRLSNRLQGPQTVTGTIGDWGDRDWLRLELPAGATLTLHLSVPPDADYDLILYGADGSRLQTSERDAGLPEAVEHTNSWTRRRVLYVKLYGYEGSWSARSPYRLDVLW